MSGSGIVIDMVSIICYQFQELSELFEICRGWHGFYGVQFFLPEMISFLIIVHV